jgi:hypothetical protein
MPTESISCAFADLPLTVGDIIIKAESRFAEIKHRRIQGSVYVEGFCSQFVLENLHITKGRLQIAGGCFQGKLSGIFVDECQDAKEPAILVGDGAGTICTTLTLERIWTRWAKTWGIRVTNQTSLTAIGLAADVCGIGGIQCVSAHGTYVGLNCESNPIGVWFYDCTASVSGHNWADNQTPVRVSGGNVDIRP